MFESSGGAIAVPTAVRLPNLIWQDPSAMPRERHRHRVHEHGEPVHGHAGRVLRRPAPARGQGGARDDVIRREDDVSQAGGNLRVRLAQSRRVLVGVGETHANLLVTAGMNLSRRHSKKYNARCLFYNMISVLVILQEPSLERAFDDETARGGTNMCSLPDAVV